VAVVMFALFGHAGGEERMILVLRCFGFGSPHFMCRRPNSAGGSSLGVLRWFFRAKVQRFGVNAGDVCGCRNPLEGRRCGHHLHAKTPGENPWPLRSRRQRHVASLRSWCVVVELWFHLVSVRSLRSSLGFSCLSFFYLDLLYKGISHHLVSVRPLWLYLKSGAKACFEIAGGAGNDFLDNNTQLC
jgi:hypothetical protein